MTQPTQEGAVGGGNDGTVVAAEPTLEDRLSAALDIDEPERKEEDEGAAASESEPELTAEDIADEDSGEAVDPPIAPPVSWTAEEKEEFGKLPRALQETLTRREAERERFVQSKAQEVKKARSEVEREALTVVQTVQRQAAERLNHFASLLEVPAPDPQQIVDDPETYAAQERAHRHYAAQRQQAQQQAAAALQQAQQAEAEALRLEQEESRVILAEKFPEYLDPAKGADLRRELGAIALELGYSEDQLATVDAKDILAMRQANEWRQDSIKYRALMAKKMEKVREAKNLPRVSRPGTSQAPGAAVTQRYQADRQAMRKGDRDASIRVFSNL